MFGLEPLGYSRRVKLELWSFGHKCPAMQGLSAPYPSMERYRCHHRMTYQWRGKTRRTGADMPTRTAAYIIHVRSSVQRCENLLVMDTFEWKIFSDLYYVTRTMKAVRSWHTPLSRFKRTFRAGVRIAPFH